MSWLYSIVFAGLLFSSQNVNVSSVSPAGAAPLTVAPKAAVGEETDRFEQSYPLNANGRVAVSNVNGSITVEAWDKNEVHLVAIKTADSKETLASVDVRVDSRADSFRVEADYDQWKMQGRDQWKSGRRLEVQFQLQVPRGAILDEVGTVNGSVTVSNFSNLTKISAVNGDVRATDLRGTANLSTVNGAVVADFDRLETGSKISLNTVNGRVNLVIPSDSNATLRADSVNGEITNDFGLPVRKGQYVGRDLYGRIGNGDVSVKLSSVNGPLTISRKQDGRTVSPATNLLPQKNKDDEEWQSDRDVDVDVDVDPDVKMSASNVAKLNRDISKANKAVTKETAAAMRETRRAIAEANAELRNMPKVVIPKVTIDTEALKELNNEVIRESVKQGMEAQREALTKLRDVHFFGSVPQVNRKTGSVGVKGVPKVTIDAMGASVRVRGWDKSEVQYTISQFSDTRSRNPVTTNESLTETNVVIKVVNNDPDGRAGTFDNEMKSVRVDVFVPRKTNLKVITNGEIRVDGVSGELDLKGDEESINVRDASGKLRVANTDGVIRVIGFHGQLDAQTSDGDLYLEGDFDKISATVDDGTVTLTVPETANASIFSNTAVDGENVKLIETGTSRWKLGSGGPNYTFRFGNGSLLVRYSGEISAS